MTQHRMPDMKEGGVNVTPLIDVVMCLIIFFMLVAKIGVSTGINNKIDAPKTYLGVKIADMGNTLALNLTKKDEGIVTPPLITVDLKGEKDKELPLQDSAGAHPLRDVLLALKKERGDGFKVIINAPKDIRYAQVQLVLQECAVAGVTNVNFVTKKATMEVGAE